MDHNMFSDLFVKVLNISIVGCYIIVAVMVFRTLILRWERKYAYLLWFVVFVNLCIPFRISGPFSLIPAWIADFDIVGKNVDRVQVSYEGKTDYLPNEEIVEVVEHHYYTTADDIPSENGIPGTDSNSESAFVRGEFEKSMSYLPNEEITATVSVHNYTSSEGENGVPGTDSNSETNYYINDSVNGSSQKMLLAIVWGIGVILLAVWNIKAVLGFHSKLKSAEPFSGDNVCEMGANAKIRTADGIETPFLWGLFSPTIYLPQMIDEEERSYIIAHESYHRKRKDYIFKPLFFIIVVIHWFNPLVWAAYLLFVRDMEISCDEAVIAGADEDIRKSYAASLLKYAARQNGYTLTPITFGEPSLRSRIKNVLQYKKRNVAISVLIMCVILVIMVGLIFRPQKKEITVEVDSQIQELDAAPADMNTDEFAEDSQLHKAVSWESGIITGTDGENEYTRILLESDIVSGEVTDFRTFSYTGNTDEKKNTMAYVMAGKRDGESITGSLWFVGSADGLVQPVMQNITVTGTQTASISFDDHVYIIINYLTGNVMDGRILPVTKADLSAEILAKVTGEKVIDEDKGAIICRDAAYDMESLIDEDLLPYDITESVDGEQKWWPETEYAMGSEANHYIVGQEYELTEEEQIRLNGLVPYYADDMNSFFAYCDTTATTVGNSRRRSAFAQINQIGETEHFSVYGTNLIDTILIKTPDERYLRIDHTFSSDYNEVPFLCEADFDADGEPELVMMGGFGLHGTGYYQEQLFIADKGEDSIWRAYELHEDIYLPMIHQHIDSVYSEEGLELCIDGKGVGHHFQYSEYSHSSHDSHHSEEYEVDDSVTYSAGAQIRFGYGESGIIPQIASGKSRIIGSRDNPDKKIVLDAMLGVYSDTVVSGIFPGNHFVAALTYEGDGAWSLAEYHHEFRY